MKSNFKMAFIVLISMTIAAIGTALVIEYSLQSNQYSEEVVQTKIDSKEMAEERKVIIHLPENYNQDTTKEYPVLYILDGTSQDLHTAEKVDLLSRISIFPEAIIVGIPNSRGHRSRDFTPHYMKVDLDDEKSDLGNGDRFLSFIANELVPYINDSYRTNGFQTLSGNSRGGLFTFYALLEKPNLFDGYLCYSPAFWREDIIIAEKVEAFFTQNSLKSKFIYLSLGDSENKKMKHGYDRIVSIIGRHEINDLHFTHKRTKNADHQSNAYKSTIYALKELGDYISSTGKLE